MYAKVTYTYYTLKSTWYYLPPKWRLITIYMLRTLRSETGSSTTTITHYVYKVHLVSQLCQLLWTILKYIVQMNLKEYSITTGSFGGNVKGIASVHQPGIFGRLQISELVTAASNFMFTFHPAPGDTFSYKGKNTVTKSFKQDIQKAW